MLKKFFAFLLLFLINCVSAVQPARNFLPVTHEMEFGEFGNMRDIADLTNTFRYDNWKIFSQKNEKCSVNTNDNNIDEFDKYDHFGKNFSEQIGRQGFGRIVELGITNEKFESRIRYKKRNRRRNKNRQRNMNKTPSVSRD